MLTVAKGRIYTDLTVIGFSELSAPLPGNTNRFVTLFRHAGLVQIQTTVSATAKKCVGIMGNLPDNQLVIPRRIG